jgi:hypothetical protein
MAERGSTAQEDRKNGKSRKAAAATNFPLPLYAAAKTPKNGYKGRGPEHSTTKPPHGTIHPSTTPPKTFNFSTHFPPTPLLQQRQIGD